MSIPEQSSSTGRPKGDLVSVRSDVRASSDPDLVGTVRTKLVRMKRRPAPPQVDPSTVQAELPPQTGTIFNIWYNKWSGGDREDKLSSQTKATSRCEVAKHTGYTKADSIPGTFFCLFFARGVCPRGRDCEYLHRLPGVFDIYSGNVDCFGREKHSDYRDDMGGVGSFMRQNRTLYVGRIHPSNEVEEVVARHFAEWGKVERIRVLPTRGVAFVTYATEWLAQFAKEAMSHQSLDHDEILNVRWATADPNPAAQQREAKRVEEQAAQAIRSALPAVYVGEIEGRDLAAKRRKKQEGSSRLDGTQSNDGIWTRSADTEGGAANSRHVSSRGNPTNAQHNFVRDLRTAEEPELEQHGLAILLPSTLDAIESQRAVPSSGNFTAPRRQEILDSLVDYDSDDA